MVSKRIHAPISPNLNYNLNSLDVRTEILLCNLESYNTYRYERNNGIVV